MREQIMTQQNFSTTISVDQSPKEVFDAISNVRGWWSGEIDGGTDKLSLPTPTRIFAAPPRGSLNSCRGKKVVWHVLESRINFVADKTEWNGRDVVFEITRKGDKAEVR
jgi:hypothetical protein